MLGASERRNGSLVISMYGIQEQKQLLNILSYFVPSALHIKHIML